MARSYSSSSGSISRAAESAPNTTGKIGDGSDGRGVIDSDGNLIFRQSDAKFFANQEPKFSNRLNPTLVEGSVYTTYKLPNGKNIMFTQYANWDRNSIGLSEVESDAIVEAFEQAGYKNIANESAFIERMQGVLNGHTRENLKKLEAWFEQKVDNPATKMAIRDARDYKPKDMADEGDIRLSGVDKPIPVVKKGDTYAIDFDKARKIIEDSNALSDKGIEKVFERLRKNGFQQA